MVNAWSLLYDEINGTLDEEYPIMTKKNEDYDDFENPNPEQYNFTSSKVTEAKSDKDWQDFWKDDGYSITGNPGPYDYYGEKGAFSFASTPKFGNASPDTVRLPFNSSPVTFGESDEGTLSITGSRLPGGMGEDHISFNYTPPASDLGNEFVHRDYPPRPAVNFSDASTRKYQEDKSITALKDYVASTYSGHYTSRNNNVQTLDLIQSVGDAESFCRSNAIKYLSRYDKKGQAKRDILKAMHYCLLLYYFSGQTHEDPTSHGYETF